MKKTALILLTITIATTGSFGLLVFYSFQQIEPSNVSQEATMGKEIWENSGCMECHAILGNGGYSAVDLTDVLSKRGEDWLKEFFDNPPLLKPSKIKYHMRLGQEDIVNIIEYFKMIEEIDTLGWPPPPLKSN